MSNMAVQMNYGEPSRGMPGGLYDRAEYEAVTRRNSAEDKALCFGYGVVQGAEPGKDIALPATDVTADKLLSKWNNAWKTLWKARRTTSTLNL